MTGQRTIYSPARRKRPHDFGTHRVETELRSSFRSDCPFCPGNEAMLPPIVAQAPGDAVGSWRTRVVFNKYPAVTPEADEAASVDGLSSPARGRHEVIIETPRHDQDLVTAPPAEIATVIETYRERFLALADVKRYRSIFIFRNHGGTAGTSLVHPHSQLIATTMVPPEARRRERRARRFYEAKGRSLFWAALEFEREDNRRMLCENGGFTAFVPFAAEVPFEIWILPKRHQANFGGIQPKEIGELAEILKDCLERLHRRLSDPDYNYAIMSAGPDKLGSPWLCWYVRIYPRLTTPAGFELASGMFINPSLPEDDAAFLRGES